jgi:IS5 family transposase
LVAGRDRFVLRARGAWWKKTGPNPTDRGKSGSKHHLLTDAQGIVLAAEVTAANVHDVRQLLPLVNAVPSIRGKRTIAWLHQFRRLRVRYERRDDIHQAFLTIGSIVTCTYFL